jgi:hypothetical protein
VFSTSTDGVAWSDTARIPIDPVTSRLDHFIPGLAVDPTTSGSSAHLALTYYFYPTAACGGACWLEVGYISSPDGGAHWSAATQLAGPMALSQIALTSQGPMVGNYISTSFSGGLVTTSSQWASSSRPRRRSMRPCTRQRRRSGWQRRPLSLQSPRACSYRSRAWDRGRRGKHCARSRAAGTAGLKERDTHARVASHRRAPVCPRPRLKADETGTLNDHQNWH